MRPKIPFNWLVATQGSQPRCRPRPRGGARLQCSCCQPGPPDRRSGPAGQHALGVMQQEAGHFPVMHVARDLVKLCELIGVEGHVRIHQGMTGRDQLQARVVGTPGFQCRSPGGSSAAIGTFQM